MGSLPSSRLTKLLQDKAEALKRRRVTAETLAREVEDRYAQMQALSIVLPEGESRATALKELVRRSDWEAVETSAKEFHAYLEQESRPRLETRLKEFRTRVERLAHLQHPVPAESIGALDEAAVLATDGKWTEAVLRVRAVNDAIRTCEASYASSLSERLGRVIEWAEEIPEHRASAEGRLKSFFEAFAAGQEELPFAETIAAIESDLPAATVQRNRVRTSGEALEAAARELGVPSQELANALASDKNRPLLDWPEGAQLVEQASSSVAGALRERVGSTLEGYRSTLLSLEEQGVDPNAPLATLERVGAELKEATPERLPQLLGEARSAVEEPVLGVVAGLLDEVRPRLVEARRLGRNATEVFSAMNRAREALRLRIYGEALAAAQEALERAEALIEDLEAARAEQEALEALLNRLEKAQVPVGSYRVPLARAAEFLARAELASARPILADTFRRLGEESLTQVRLDLERLERVGRQGEELGFTPAGFLDQIGGVRSRLEEGEIAEGAEAAARLQVELRAAAGPYVARRIDEVGKGLEEIPDPALASPVRRLLADADVSLRVKDDLPTAIDTLHRAEREFSVVFAQHASALVEGLEEERRLLESMGGAGDEMQRQIDEVQQIFNMGEFVKAFRASQEIRTRARQQQLLRSEEALSHAKLALVELGKMGLDTTSLRSRLDQSIEAVRAARFLEGWRAATGTFDEAQRLRRTAQAILDRTGEVQELIESLRTVGVVVEGYSDELDRARASYQALEFTRARDLLDALHERLEREQARHEALRLLDEADALAEDGRRLSVPIEPLAERVRTAREALAASPGRESWGQARAVHTDIVQLLRPVFEENVRALERDVEIARSAELDVTPVVEQLTELRRRLSLPVPAGLSELLETARGRFHETRGFLEHAERAMRRARDAFNQAEVVRVEVRTFRPRLERVERHLAERDYARTIELASTLERELAQAAHHQVSKSLANFQGIVSRARQQGAQTALAENLLEQARGQLENARPLEALQLAARSESELERVELQRIIAQGSFDTIQRRIEMVMAQGLAAPVAREEIRRAREALEARDYPPVLERCMLAADALADAQEGQRRSRESIESAERQLKEASEMGAEVQEGLPLLEAARELDRTGEYAAALRRARDAGESARWSTERLYTASLTEIRTLLEIVQSTASEGEGREILSALDNAEAALKVRDWARATGQVERARATAFRALDVVVTAAERTVSQLYAGMSTAEGQDGTQRADMARRVAEARERHEFAAALELLREEESRIRERWKLNLAHQVQELQDHLWVGEKLGIDTTPVMEVFSEAKLALDSNRLDAVPSLVHRGTLQLESLVRRRIEEKIREVETELLFAQDGLHVTLGPVPQRLEQSRGALGEGRPVDAARLLLETEEELGRRKALHRELMNLHYLVDAALARATERRLDVVRPRELLTESLRLRAEDYGPALEKAREALQLLQELLR
ncbi:MAG: hypothetical protein L3K13_02800 [Thermoplasmata archaeon]|nr:hypothetical protein [Thermoplasmata archaeon]